MGSDELIIKLWYLLLTDRTAPVKAPLAMEFHGSSFFLIYTKEQSMAENNPPHTAKLPVRCAKYND